MEHLRETTTQPEELPFLPVGGEPPSSLALALQPLCAEWSILRAPAKVVQQPTCSLEVLSSCRGRLDPPDQLAAFSVRLACGGIRVRPKDQLLPAPGGGPVDGRRTPGRLGSTTCASAWRPPRRLGAWGHLGCP